MAAKFIQKIPGYFILCSQPEIPCSLFMKLISLKILNNCIFCAENDHLDTCIMCTLWVFNKVVESYGPGHTSASEFCMSGNFISLFTYAGLLAATIHHEGSKFSDIFQLKHGSFADLPASKISEMMKLNSLEVMVVTFPISGKGGSFCSFSCSLFPDLYSFCCPYGLSLSKNLLQNASTQSLFSVVNKILDESIERKNGDIPQVRKMEVKEMPYHLHKCWFTRFSWVKKKFHIEKNADGLLYVA